MKFSHRSQYGTLRKRRRANIWATKRSVGDLLVWLIGSKKTHFQRQRRFKLVSILNTFIIYESLSVVLKNHLCLTMSYVRLAEFRSTYNFEVGAEKNYTRSNFLSLWSTLEYFRGGKNRPAISSWNFKIYMKYNLTTGQLGYFKYNGPYYDHKTEFNVMYF